jgi:hypothetical protein
MKAVEIIYVTRLWGEDWQVWELVENGSTTPRLLPGNSTPFPGKISTILSVPARAVIAVPLWIDSTDRSVIDESVELELEVRGLLSRKLSSDVVRLHEISHEGRTLIVSAVFSEPQPLAERGHSFSRYEASPCLLSLTDGITLWREAGDIVAAFVREGSLVYWATQDADCENAVIRAWLDGIIFYLQGSDIMPHGPLPRAWDEFLAPKFGSEGLPGGTVAHSLVPATPTHTGKWLPDIAREKLEGKIRRQKWLRMASLLAIPYGLMLLGVGLYFGWLSLRAQSLRSELATLETEVSLFQDTARDWRLVRSAVDSDFYPVEILYGLVQNMPANGLRLTLYDVTDGRVTVQGEAASASQATQFFAAISAVPALQPLQWQMPTPALLPNNAAQFQLTGNVP